MFLRYIIVLACNVFYIEMLSPLRSSDILTLSKGIRSELLQHHAFIEVRRVASNEWLKWVQEHHHSISIRASMKPKNHLKNDQRWDFERKEKKGVTGKKHQLKNSLRKDIFPYQLMKERCHSYENKRKGLVDFTNKK